jgi:hypothetical protein
MTTTYIFDTQTQHWSTLYRGNSAGVTWSGDSRFIYFLGTFVMYFGLDPTDAPLMLRDVSTSDVYSLTLEQK